MAKKIRKKHSKAAVGEYAVTAAGSQKGEHDGAGEDMMDYDGEAGDGRMFDSEDEREIVPDVDDGAHRQAEHEKTAKQPRKKKQHGKKGTGDNAVNPAEDGDFERPRKRHRPRSSDASPGRSRSASADSASLVPSSPVSSSREHPAEAQSLLDHQSHIPTPPPPSLQRFPLPSRPHAPEKAELASQGLDRALAGAQLVDPLLSTPLSPEEDGNDITGLSAKTLRRLRDLGIEELFAGVYRVPPFNKLIFRVCKLSPDYAAAVAPPFRTSEAVPVPPV